jgi:hypothetical protein
MNEGGLLGILGLSSGDATKDAAISHGLLQAGLSLLGARGRLGPALGQAGMVGLQGMQQYGQNQFQQTLQKAQLDELKRKQDMQQRGDAFRDSLVSPQMQASQGAMAGGGGPTMANAQKMPAVDPGHQMLFDAVKAGIVDPATYIASTRKDTTPIKLGEGDKLVQPGTYKELASNPKHDKPAQTELNKLLMEMNSLQPDDPRRAIYLDAIKKATTHSPAVQVSYGAPVAGQDQQGNPVFFQPSKDGKSPPSIITGVAPPARETPAALKQKMAENEVTLNKIDRALALVDEKPKSLGMQNMLGDTVMQRFDPGGVEVRAMVADIGGQKIHDRSGASVTVSEAPRLTPFVPSATDNAETVKKKLGLFRQEYAAMQQALKSGASIEQASAKPASMLPDASAIDAELKRRGHR